MSSIRHIQRWTDRDLSLPPWVVATPIVSVLFAEAALFYGELLPALSVYVLCLLFCLLAPVRYEPTLPLLGPLVLLPLFRLVQLGSPTFFELTLLSFPLTYLPLLPALYLIVRTEGIRIGMNYRALLAGVVPIVMLSAPLALGEYLILRPVALIPDSSAMWLLAITAIMVGTVGVVEELLFRGILQRRFSDYLGRLGGIALTSLLFGAMHSVYGSEQAVVYLVFLGVVFGSLYEWTDSIGLVSVLHGTVNVFLFGLFPIYSPSLIY